MSLIIQAYADLSWPQLVFAVVQPVATIAAACWCGMRGL